MVSRRDLGSRSNQVFGLVFAVDPGVSLGREAWSIAAQPAAAHATEELINAPVGRELRVLLPGFFDGMDLCREA